MNKIMLGNVRWCEDNKIGQCGSEHAALSETAPDFWINFRYPVSSSGSDLVSNLDRFYSSPLGIVLSASLREITGML